MLHRNGPRCPFHSSTQLQHASYVGGHHQLRRGAADVFHLFIKNFHREFVVCNVVTTGAAATLIGMRHLFETQAYSTQKLARSVANALSVSQMARILVRGFFLKPSYRVSQSELREEFGYVFYFCSELFRALMLLIFAQEIAIFL